MYVISSHIVEYCHRNSYREQVRLRLGVPQLFAWPEKLVTQIVFIFYQCCTVVLEQSYIQIKRFILIFFNYFVLADDATVTSGLMSMTGGIDTAFSVTGKCF